MHCWGVLPEDHLVSGLLVGLEGPPRGSLVCWCTAGDLWFVGALLGGSPRGSLAQVFGAARGSSQRILDVRFVSALMLEGSS